MTPLSGDKAHPISGFIAAVLLLAAASPSVGGGTFSQAQHPVEQQTSPAAQALRCEADVKQCVQTCRVDNQRAARQCQRDHGALQAGSCRPDPSHCSCFATAPTCLPRANP